jgi:choline-sulfatase
MKKRPNILFLMGDQHRADVAGFEGNRVVRTPTLDKLANSGVVFHNAYTPSPKCIPARQSIMAGQLPKTCGCEVEGQDLKPEHLTFSRRFAQYAYRTVLCGQNFHFGQDIMQGWTHTFGNAISKEIINPIEEEFDKYKTPENRSEAKHIQLSGIGRGFQVVRDEYTLQGALNFIHEYFNSPYDDRIDNSPVLLKVVFSQPHYPFTAEEEKFNYYLNRVEPFLNESSSEHPVLSKRKIIPGIDVTDREIHRATAAYYAMVETMDDYCGQIIESLGNVGQNVDDWIIIYAGDHGEMLGEHCAWWKEKFYEASVRVPLILRWPKKLPTGKTVNENVSLCDLFATLCELSGIPIPEGLDSRSLVSLMMGNANDWNNEVVSQFFGGQMMIKKDHLKYQYYGKDIPEVLFDLERDPKETKNYIDDSEYDSIVAEFRLRCKELQK